MAPTTREVREHYARLSATYERKANRACERAYVRLLARHFAGVQRVLELGSGTSGLLARLDAPAKVACDLSAAMLRAGTWGTHDRRVVADAQGLPFREAGFDGVFCINLLEHVPEPKRVIEEAARVLEPGGRFLAVTPNGGVGPLLGLLERLHLKLPEGPCRFLTFKELAGLVSPRMNVVEHRFFLAFPVGHARFVERIDRLGPGPRGWGLFQYIVARGCGTGVKDGEKEPQNEG